ncbi:SGNH/GDSL hydrolase family protein [Mumia zhuanghuii]|uniref:SGNH/GDSL hydrolase family protein n=1 Tax=Mumia zhuanghuii TaxID=2585211 RepID=UPI00363BDD01
MASPATADEPVKYVALGDSMASGPLILPFTGPIACGRSTRNYARLLAAQVKATSFTDVTCSGADTGDLFSPMKLSLAGVDAGTAPAQLDALKPDTTLVTLTIGGNDAGLVGVAQDCIRLNYFATPCMNALTAGGVDKIANRINDFAPDLAASLQRIHALSPQARVLVTGYGYYIKRNGCWPKQPWLPKDANYLQEKVHQLNVTIAAVAAANDAEYVDVETPSVGHDACQAPATRWVEGLVPTSPASPLHPNAAGEAAYASIIGATL